MSRTITRGGQMMRRLSAVALASLVWWALVPGLALADDDEDDDGRGNNESDLEFEAELSPGEEVRTPPVVSDGEGEVSFRVEGSSVSFKLKWEDLTTGAFAGHIHCGAIGVNGPVGVTLLSTAMGTDGKVKGTFTAPDANNGCGWTSLGAVVSAMLSGNTYVNVHTPTYPGGEIRGQVGADDLEFEAELSPGEEVRTPPVVSDGEGEVSFRVEGSSVSFKLKWEDLTTGAFAGHIHCGAIGVNGPVGVTLLSTAMGTDGKVKGTFTAPDANNGCGWTSLGAVVSAMLSGNTYVNVHTPTYPGGEIRGQVGTDD